MITKNYIILSKKGLFHEAFMKLVSLSNKKVTDVGESPMVTEGVGDKLEFEIG